MEKLSNLDKALTPGWVVAQYEKLMQENNDLKIEIKTLKYANEASHKEPYTEDEVK